MLPRLLVLGVLLGAPAARAGWPDDVSLSALGSWNGSPVVDQAAIADGWRVLVRELGASIATGPVFPAETLGLSGFEVGTHHTLSFIDSRGTEGEPAPWERVHPDGEPPRTLWVPHLDVRKGLPASFELGATAGYVAFSRQTTFGGFGRWAPLEGYRQLPDLVLQLGYTGYTGNEELELGVMDLTATVGYTLPFGSIVGINSASFSPYAGGGLLRVHARPLLPQDELEVLGIGEVSGFSRSDAFDPSYRFWRIQGGFRIASGGFLFRLAGALAPGVLPTVDVGVGLAF